MSVWHYLVLGTCECLRKPKTKNTKAATSAKPNIVTKHGKHNMEMMFGRKRPRTEADQDEEELVSWNNDIEIRDGVVFKSSKSNAKSKRDMIKEISILGALQSSNHIVKLLSYCISSSGSVLVCTQYCGKDLLTMLPLAVGDARNIFEQILDAVSFMHGMNVVHRDLKLENIVMERGHVRLIDFDQSLFLTKNAEGVFSYLDEFDVGTMSYIAPETNKRISYDGFAADIWQLAIILFAMYFNIFPWHSAQEDNLSYVRFEQMQKAAQDDNSTPTHIVRKLFFNKVDASLLKSIPDWVKSAFDRMFFCDPSRRRLR